jgi:predicted nucleotidyltransferase
MGENGNMTLDDLRGSKRQEILRLAGDYGARNVRVFGSFSRGENKASTDIDFLVDLDPGRTLMDLGGLLVELQRTLDLPVDVTTEKMLRPRIREQALRDAVLL